MSDTKPASPSRLAADICRNIILSDEAKALLEEDLLSMAFLGRLQEHGLHVDGIRFLAHVLPNREAVWWASLCVRCVAARTMPLKEQAALRAAGAWVLKPDESRRRAAHRAAQEATVETPAGCAAQAAGWCDGKTGTRTAKITGAAIFLAATHGKNEPSSFLHRQFLAVGLEVFTGAARWDPKPAGKR